MDSNKWLPTGQWNGFYIESYQSQRGWMHQYLEFADNKMVGEGTDYVGPWTLSGVYDLAKRQATWVKHYVGKHDVNYSGQISDKGIIGVWDIRGLSDGPFHIWPQHMTEFDSMYMQEDLEKTPMRRPPQQPLDFDLLGEGQQLA